MNKSMEPGEITEYISLKDGMEKKNDYDDETATLTNPDGENKA
jgi:hypothetical protein